MQILFDLQRRYRSYLPVKLTLLYRPRLSSPRASEMVEGKVPERRLFCGASEVRLHRNNIRKEPSCTCEELLLLLHLASLLMSTTRFPTPLPPACSISDVSLTGGKPDGNEPVKKFPSSFRALREGIAAMLLGMGPATRMQSLVVFHFYLHHKSVA